MGKWYFQRQHVLDPDAVSVLKHQTLSTKLHVQAMGLNPWNIKVLIQDGPCFSVDTWQVCAHSFTCTSWYRNKESWVLFPVWCWAKPGPFWASVISSFRFRYEWSIFHLFNAPQISSPRSWPDFHSLVVFSCLLTQRIHDDQGYGGNDSSIIKVAAWAHKTKEELRSEGGVIDSELEMTHFSKCGDSLMRGGEKVRASSITLVCLNFWV